MKKDSKPNAVSLNKSEIASLEIIYTQASEWIRLSNNVIWVTGTFLVSVAGGCIGLTLQFPNGKYFLAFSSIFLFTFWIYITRYYGSISVKTREVLMKIEDHWNIPDEISLYKRQGYVTKIWYSLSNIQIAVLILLIILWIAIINYEL